MPTQTLLEKSKSVPFTLSFIQGIEREMYDKAIIDSEAMAQSYDPKTQLSNLSIYSGTNLTYDISLSGFPFKGKDDTEQTDT
jgi:hypothetical protein